MNSISISYVDTEITTNQRLGYSMLEFLFGEKLGYNEESLKLLKRKHKFPKHILDLAQNFVNYQDDNGCGIAIRYLSHQLAHEVDAREIIKKFGIHKKYGVTYNDFQEKTKREKCPHCGGHDTELSSISQVRVNIQCNTCGKRFMSKWKSVTPWKEKAMELYLTGLTYKEVSNELGIDYQILSIWGRKGGYSRPVGRSQSKQ